MTSRQAAPLGACLGHLAVAFERRTDFGLSLPSMFGGEPIPPLGARIDIEFAGTMTGALAGTVRGTDYLTIRPGLQITRHPHLAFLTDTGGRVAAAGEGVVTPTASVPVTDTRIALLASSRTPSTAWIDGQTLWAVGEIDPFAGTLVCDVYLSAGEAPDER